jgi:uncharacterized protein (DUF1800 family)
MAASLMAACGGGTGATADGAASTSSALTTSTDKASVLVADNRSARAATVPVTLTVRAYGSLAGNVGPLMQVRLNGATLATIEVRASEPQDYAIPISALRAGDKLDIAFTNDALIDGQDRNLYVVYVTDGTAYMTPTQPGVVLDAGSGAEAFDGLNLSAGTEALYFNAALRLTWPETSAYALSGREMDSSRFLQQASFGPTRAEITRLNSMAFDAWIDEQIAMPAQPEYLNYIQAKYDLGPDYLPDSSVKYTPDWLAQKFWAGVATGPDQLRKRTAFALHSIFVVSQVDSNLFHQARAYANYLDNLNRLAFGNFRELIEEVALSPAMGIYLSHMRNQREDPASNRLPDENFARELMQLFTIGLYELNLDGTHRLDSQGRPIETYGNADVMAMAKVFTGWSWGFDDNQLTEYNFRWGMPSAVAKGAARVDVRRMKPYPGMSSTAEKKLFAGKPQAITIPPQTGAAESVRIALDTLFNHPNVGPFIGRQLIQRLVTGNPSPDYVRRVAATFNNNGRGVRGDLAAVVRAVLMDVEARSAPVAGFGKVREPVLRVAHWLRAFGARSAGGEYLMATEPTGLGQRANYMPSVFGYFRPGYVPPSTMMAGDGVTAPELQIVDEASTASWINAMELMLREGIGWFGTARDVTVQLNTEAGLVAQEPEKLLRHLDLMLFAGRMSPALRKDVMDAIQGVPEGARGRDTVRAKVAVFMTTTAPEYLVQR